LFRWRLIRRTGFSRWRRQFQLGWCGATQEHGKTGNDPLNGALACPSTRTANRLLVQEKGTTIKNPGNVLTSHVPELAPDTGPSPHPAVIPDERQLFLASIPKLPFQPHEIHVSPPKQPLKTFRHVIVRNLDPDPSSSWTHLNHLHQVPKRIHFRHSPQVALRIIVTVSLVHSTDARDVINSLSSACLLLPSPRIELVERAVTGS
jgi:hypothetical protein